MDLQKKKITVNGVVFVRKLCHGCGCLYMQLCLFHVVQ